jgi:hypothetical protein
MLVDLDDRQGRGVVRRDSAALGDPVAHQAGAEVPPEPIRRDASHEHDRLAETGDGPCGVVGTAARPRLEASIRTDDEIDQGLAGYDDHGPMVVGV